MKKLLILVLMAMTPLAVGCSFTADESADTPATPSEQISTEYQNSKPSSETEPTQIQATFQSASYTYEVTPLKENPYDKQIIARSLSTDEQIVLLPSIKDVIQLSWTHENASVELFESVPESDYLILREVLMDTDAGGGLFWKFNLQTKELSYFEYINEIVDGFGYMTSFNNHQYLFVPETTIPTYSNEEIREGLSQDMYFIDFTGDQYKVAYQVLGDETFNKGYGALSNSFDITPYEDGTVVFTTYTHPSSGEGEKQIAQQESVIRLDLESPF